MAIRKRICFVVARMISAKSFLKDHIKALSKDYDIYVVANTSGETDLSIENVKEIKHIPIERSIRIGTDLRALAQLTSYFKDMKFDAVHSVTPKAGLLTALAAKFAGIKHRTHIFTGQVWATRTGAMRTLLKQMDCLINSLDNHILVDGEAQRKFLIKEGVISETKSKVLGAGSICGADTERYTPTLEERENQRKALGLNNDRVVFTFMGRLNKDKGIYELLEAFNNIVKERPNAYLLIFGFDEENCLSHLSDYTNIRKDDNFLFYGPTRTPHLSLQASDIFVLPSYREGFGLSVIEASCLGIPVICSDAYGLADTMVDNVTGLRCKVADSISLQKAMMELYDNPSLRTKLGKNGRNRVLELFAGEKIVGAWKAFYDSILQ